MRCFSDNELAEELEVTTGLPEPASAEAARAAPERAIAQRAAAHSLQARAGAPAPDRAPPPPAAPPSPPAQPAPPHTPPLPPAAPGSRTVENVADLQSAVSNPGILRVNLMAAGSPYLLDAELVLATNVTLQAENGTFVVLDAQASAQNPRRVLSVNASATIELVGLVLIGAWTGSGSSGGGATASRARTRRQR